MPMQKRVLGPIEDRPLPKPGLPEAVIPEGELRKKTVDEQTVLEARVPAFTIDCRFPMWWNGLCLNAGTNFVDVARFNALPLRTRRAVRQHVLDGEFGQSGYVEACKQLGEVANASASGKAIETVEEKKRREAEEADRKAAANEFGNLEAEAAAQKKPSKAAKSKSQSKKEAGEFGNLD